MSNIGINPAVSMNILKSRILNPAMTSIYSVLIGRPPSSEFSFPAYDRELLELTCVEASLPGSSIATIETSRDFTGIVEKHAYSRLYDDTIDFTFMVTLDSNYMQIRFFDYWMKFIVGEDKDGIPILAVTKRLHKHLPAETMAAAIWLNNRRPDRWRQRQEIVINPDTDPLLIFAKEMREFRLDSGSTDTKTKNYS